MVLVGQVRSGPQHGTKGRRRRKERAMKHYELYSWSAQYRQERLAEAGRLRLEEKLRASREPRGLRNPLKALRKAVASLRATSEPGDPPAVETPAN
jgi:hypothetical protein